MTNSLYEYYDNNIGEALIKNPDYGQIGQGANSDKEYIPNPNMIQWTISRLFNMSKINHCEVFLEEPELNLFPPTQQILMRNLLRLLGKKRENMLFISTHSPYILDILLEKETYDYGLFYVHSSESGSIVKTATEEDVQDMFEAGVDAFFNIERLGDEA